MAFDWLISRKNRKGTIVYVARSRFEHVDIFVKLTKRSWQDHYNCSGNRSKDPKTTIPSAGPRRRLLLVMQLNLAAKAPTPAGTCPKTPRKTESLAPPTAGACEKPAPQYIPDRQHSGAAARLRLVPDTAVHRNHPEAADGPEDPPVSRSGRHPAAEDGRAEYGA